MLVAIRSGDVETINMRSTMIARSHDPKLTAFLQRQGSAESDMELPQRVEHDHHTFSGSRTPLV